MTRTALRRAVRPYRDSIVAWFAYSGDSPLPRSLRRAGFRKLPWTDSGCERTVLLGPGFVVKTDTEYCYPPRAKERFQRSRLFAPMIKIADGIVAQPRGRPITKCRSRWWKKTRERYYLLQERAEKFDIYDTHEGNFAVFPDRTIRCIDY